MSYVVIDFETTAILPRPAYPPKPVSVSILREGHMPEFHAWGHSEGNNSTTARVQEILQGIWWSDAELIFHNAKFDLEVAQKHFGLRLPDWRRVHDTLYLLFLRDPYALSFSLKPAAERLLGEPPVEQEAVRQWLIDNKIVRRTQKDWGAYISQAPANIVGPYANGDTQRTHDLFKLLYPEILARGMAQAYNRERELMPILLRNEQEGISTNEQQIFETGRRLHQDKEKAENYLRQRLGVPGLDFNQDEKVANALDVNKLVDEWKKTPTGRLSMAGKGLKIKDPQVASALGFISRAQTCIATFLEPWYLQSAATGGLIYTNWNQIRGERGGARTGRLSSTPNFQNIPKDFSDKNDGYLHPLFLRIDPLPLIRKLILPDYEDHIIVHRDYNQQELRILADFEAGALFEAFMTDPLLDVHKWVQGEMQKLLGKEVKRRPVKILNFSVIYGGGLDKIRELLGCELEEARTLKLAHAEAMPGIKELRRDINFLVRENKPIHTWGGREYYCEPPIEKAGRIYTFEYKLLNYMIQGSAADCTKQALINYDTIRKHGRLMLTVHDEINISCPRSAAKQESELLRQAMEGVKFQLPMLTTAKQGINWGTLEEV